MRSGIRGAGDAERDQRCGGCGAEPRRGGCCDFSLFPLFSSLPLGGPSLAALLVPPAQEGDCAHRAPPRARPLPPPPRPLLATPRGTGGPWARSPQTRLPFPGAGMPCAPGMLMPAVPATGWKKSPLHLQSPQDWVLPPPGMGRNGVQPSCQYSSPGLEQRCPHAPPKPSPTSFMDIGRQQETLPTSVVRELHHPENPVALSRTVRKCGASAAGSCCLVSWHSFKSHTRTGAPISGSGVPAGRTSRLSQHGVLPIPKAEEPWRPAGSRVPGTAGTPPALPQLPGCTGPGMQGPGVPREAD